MRSIALSPCTPCFRTYFPPKWLGTVPVKNKVNGKLTNCQSGLVSFTIKIIEMDRYFSSYFLISADYLPLCWVFKNTRATVLVQGKAPICMVEYKNIHNSEINGLGTLHIAFPALLKTWLTGYSTSEEEGLQKTEKLIKQLGLLHYGKPISNRPVFQWLPLTFGWLLPQNNPNNLAWEKSPSCAKHIQNDPHMWD